MTKTKLPVLLTVCSFFLFILALPVSASAKEAIDRSAPEMGHSTMQPDHTAAPGEGGHQHMEMPKEDPAVGLDEQIGSAIPLELTFRDESGQPVTLGQLVNGPTIIAPIYYRCPNVCNFLQSDLARVLPDIRRKPGSEYSVISISFDDSETPELAAKNKDMYFKAMRGAFPEDAWRFLTGDMDAIMKLTGSAGYRFRKMHDGQFLHPVAIFVVDSQGTIIRYLHGTRFLPKDITLALVEASDGRLGTTIQKVVQFCFSYDAENKTYVFNLLRVSGSVILLTAFAFLAFLFFGGKKKKRED